VKLRAIAIALAALAVALAACGSADSPSGADVVKAWTDAVRAGHYAEAADLFALPAVIANGTPKVRVSERSEVDAFNRALPCGAVLLDVRPSGDGYLLATFRLVDGPGGRDCGSGTGHTAQVSFRVVDGHIVEWLREGTGTPPSSPDNGVVHV
jgi:hypothetical protein